ncbi:hypothetical protein BABINDRAFT_131551 [Babjeviella inositovora NRRL Y-12698]|uniref:K Homology domain-containing protein n=1 Tax=Babjeviella inositovora NRRL Y-12698 TaxID=984486 RepID=A0A1E3QS09_9ASCO|nr:uncharacterized protein BABINDRAFT_131551 [Babjeviella inositovora NRRL Y-12698]ODQ80284.1 hypothetical protein BABINDRAFT_131551 [Babjeviella inositovora NRRL Y-12698]
MNRFMRPVTRFSRLLCFSRGYSVDKQFDLFGDISIIKQDVPVAANFLRHITNTGSWWADLVKTKTTAAVEYDLKHCIIRGDDSTSVAAAKSMLDGRLHNLQELMVIFPLPPKFASFFDNLESLQKSTNTTVILVPGRENAPELIILGDSRGEVQLALKHVQTRLMNLKSYSKEIMVLHLIIDSLRRDNQLEALQKTTRTTIQVQPQIDADYRKTVSIVSAYENGTREVERFFNEKAESMSCVAHRLMVDYTTIDLLTQPISASSKYSTLKKIEAITSTTITVGTVIDTENKCEVLISGSCKEDAEEALSILGATITSFSQNTATLSVPKDIAYQLVGRNGLSVFDLASFRGVTFSSTPERSGDLVKMAIQAEDRFQLEEVRDKIESFLARFKHVALPGVSSAYMKVLMGLKNSSSFQEIQKTTSSRINTTRDPVSGEHTVNIFAENDTDAKKCLALVSERLELLRQGAAHVLFPYKYKDTFTGFRKHYILQAQVSSNVDITMKTPVASISAGKPADIGPEETVELTIVGDNAAANRQLGEMFRNRLDTIAALAQEFTFPEYLLDAFLFHDLFKLGSLKEATKTTIYIYRQAHEIRLVVCGLEPGLTSECSNAIRERIGVYTKSHQVFTSTRAFAQVLIGPNGARIDKIQKSTNCSISLTEMPGRRSEIHVMSNDPKSVQMGMKLLRDLLLALEESNASAERQ